MREVGEHALREVHRVTALGHYRRPAEKRERLLVCLDDGGGRLQLGRAETLAARRHFDLRPRRLLILLQLGLELRDAVQPDQRGVLLVVHGLIPSIQFASRSRFIRRPDCLEPRGVAGSKSHPPDGQSEDQQHQQYDQHDHDFEQHRHGAFQCGFRG